MTAEFNLERRRLKLAFERAVATYDAGAVLQREVGERLRERLELVDMRPKHVLDVGCGTGRGSAVLAHTYHKAEIIALDLAEQMARRARRKSSWRRKIHAICGDVEALALTEASVELIHANLVLQWCRDLDRGLAELRRVLRPRGLLLFTTFGPDTLRELRAAWAAADSFKHVNHFFDMHDIGDALVRSGFVEPVMDVEHITMTYPDVKGLMRDLKAIGAHNIREHHDTGLAGRGRLARMREAYEQYRRDGRLPATYEVIYGTAWTPRQPANASVTRGASGVSLASLREQLRRKRQ